MAFSKLLTPTSADHVIYSVQQVHEYIKDVLDIVQSEQCPSAQIKKLDKTCFLIREGVTIFLVHNSNLFHPDNR